MRRGLFALTRPSNFAEIRTILLQRLCVLHTFTLYLIQFSEGGIYLHNDFARRNLTNTMPAEGEKFRENRDHCTRAIPARGDVRVKLPRKILYYRYTRYYVYREVRLYARLIFLRIISNRFSASNTINNIVRRKPGKKDQGRFTNTRWWKFSPVSRLARHIHWRWWVLFAP